MIAIDLGSNTIRFLAADDLGNELWETQFVVRAAENLLQSGEISQRALDRIAAAIDDAKKQFDFGGHGIAAVTTEAFRRAKNQRAALEFLRQKSGIVFEVIDPATEARLTAQASAEAARQRGVTGPLAVLDIGGASSEAIYLDSHIRHLVSLPLGIVTVTELGLDKAALESHLARELKALEPFLKQCAALPRPKALIATAGTPTTLAAIKLGLDYENYDKHQVNGTPLTLTEMDAAYRELIKTDPAKLERLVGKNRSDLILGGTLMLKAFVRALGFENCLVFDEGLREGVMTAALRGEFNSKYIA